MHVLWTTNFFHSVLLQYDLEFQLSNLFDMRNVNAGYMEYV